MVFAGVNVWAVLGAAVASMVIGMLWYSPMLFGKMWVDLMGMTKEKMEAAKKKGMAMQYVLAFISALVVGFVLSRFAGAMGVMTTVGALKLAGWAWLGFEVTVLLNGALWGGKPWKLYFIDVAHHLISLAVMAVIVVKWG